METIDRGRKRRWLVLLTLLIAAAVGGYFAYHFWFAENGSDEEAINTYEVTTTTIRFTVTTSGVAQAVKDTVLSFGIAGRVSAVEVELGDEVKTGQQVASLESDALENQLATAEANLLSARIRLRQIQEGASDADKASAEKAVVSAQVALDTASNDLKDLLEGPSEAELAAGEERVRSAESALLAVQDSLRKLQEGPSEAELAAAEERVKSAESALLAAQDSLRKLQEGSSEADLAAAEANVATAEANLTSAKSLRTSAEASVQSAAAALQSAATAYCDTGDHIEGICDEFRLPLSNRQIGELNESIRPEEDPSPEDAALAAATSALVKANSTYSSALTAKNDAEAAADAAEAALTSAQEALDALKAEADPEELATAEAVVIAAEQALEAVQLQLDELRERSTEPDPEELAMAEAAVTAAEQGLEAAQLQLDELREGPTESAIAAAQGAVDTAGANLAAAIAARDDLLAGASQEDIDLQVQQVRVAELAVEQARRNLEDAALVAPFDGTAAAIAISVGDLVTSAVPAITLLTPDALEVELTLGETDLPRVRVGQKGVIIFDAIQEKAYQLTVTSIGLAPTTQQGVVTYLATAQLTGFDPNADVRPAPGMSGAAVIVAEEKTGVLAVPNPALRRRGQNQTVEVVVDGKLETRVVLTGITDAEKTEILSGLEAGDRVALPGGAPAQEGVGEAEELPGGIR